MTDIDPTDTVDPVADAAAAAMMTVFDRALGLSAPHKHLVFEALEAAAAVYEAAHEDVVRDTLDRTGFAGMDIVDGVVRMRIQYAADFAESVVEAFDTLCEQRGVTNYVEWASTILDPATKAAIEAGADVVPEYRRYTFIVVKPGMKSPHELRLEADARLAAVVALAERGGVLDPRDVLTAAGRQPECTCPGGPDGGWKTDFDTDCPRHTTTGVTQHELMTLLPVARDATRWEMGAWPDVCAPRDEQGPVPDALLVNVLVNVLGYLRTPAVVRAEDGPRG